jgi:EAL domain-containing protein (putative c-di-GMP-specific phosphodiesterase class I)
VAELARLGLEVPVGVNLATRDLLDPSLPGAVDAILAANGVEARFLEVEITEGVMVVDFHTSVRTLNQLRRRGVAVAVDDFGTGYSSLTYLHKLPLDSLKIDRSFTNRLRSERSAAAIVRASIRLAHDLGLTVVAEGVEDEATLDRLTALGCDQAQGYLLARPMPARDFLDWMIQHHGYALPRPPLQGSLGGR